MPDATDKRPARAPVRVWSGVGTASAGAASSASGAEDRPSRAGRASGRTRQLRADSPVTVDDPDAVRGRRVVVVEDGPTLTHGSMVFGAGVAGARAAGASEIVNPASAAVGSIAETYARYPHAVGVIPAMGYGDAQVRDLAATIEAVDCDVEVSGTPIDLARLVSLSKPIVRARYELRERRPGGLAEVLADTLARVGRG